MFFSGKGGVGKTTCAAARAIAASRSSERVLVVSTDPAHSLGDALAVRLTGRPSAVARNLHAAELDAPRAFARWRSRHGRALGDALEHGTWLDRDDVDELLGLSIPGIDELIALIEISRLSRRQSPAFDTVIVDTAPTGHTLRLLASPDAVAAVAGVLDTLQREHRMVREQLAGVRRPESADRLIEMLGEQARELSALLRDRRRCAVHWVLLPEELSVAETEDGLRALAHAGIHVPELVVNRVTPEGPRCPICDNRRAGERRVIAAIERRLGRRRVVRFVPAEIHEPRGVPALARIGKALGERPSFAVRGSSFVVREPAFSAPERRPSDSIAVFRGARLLLFGGKGGVGKTTCAAAAALRLAASEPARPVLLLSTDPAHSLGDVLGLAIGDRARSVPGAPANLRVRELDAAAAMAARRAGIEAALEEIASAFGAGLDEHRGRGVSELMDLAPPGIDELFAVLSIGELLSPGQDRLVVLDTAPTGHALRLLEMPDTAREWTQVLMRVLLKYRELRGPGKLGAELVSLSKSIRRLGELLHNPRDTRFIVVSRAADVPRLETERLLRALRRMRLAVPALVINAATLAPGRCPRCRATAAAERPQRGALARACRTRSRDCAIILAPLSAPPPRGVAQLEVWARLWSEQ